MIFDHPECFNENSKFDSLNIFFTSKIFTFAARKKKKKPCIYQHCLYHKINALNIFWMNKDYFIVICLIDVVYGYISYPWYWLIC